MRIHGLVYIIIGIFVAVTSFYLFKANQQFMFYVVGGALISFGIVKILIDKVREPKYEEQPKQAQQQPQRQHQQRYKPTQEMFASRQPSNQSTRESRYCYQCGSQIHVGQNFCHNCGVRLR